jgi:methylated-DNA-[protein]-cysteine S-methyltransferase
LPIWSAIDVLEKGETTPLFVAFGLTAHPSDDRHGDGARFTSASCGRARRNATAGIGLNLGLEGACFLGDETGSNAMSQDARHYHVFETAMGFCAIAWSDAGVARFQLPTNTAEAAERLMRRRAFGAEPGAPQEGVADVIEAAKRYFDGEETDFSQVQLDLAGQDAFFAQIYDALRQVGWGRTTTYGALAKEVGAGREAARDVGEAMARNPTPLIIPCHRVLAAGGKIGGFSAPGGSKTKARMLELEGVRLGPPEAAQQAFSF